MRSTLAAALLAFSLAFGAVAYHKLSAEAFGLAIGVALGMLAGIPAATLLLRVTKKQTSKAPPNYQPPIIVIGNQRHQPAPTDHANGYIGERYWLAPGDKQQPVIIGAPDLEPEPRPATRELPRAGTTAQQLYGDFGAPYEEDNGDNTHNEITDPESAIFVWVTELCEESETWTSVGDLYAAFELWAESNSVGYIDVAYTQFGAELTALGVRKRRIGSGVQYRLSASDDH